MITGTVSRLVTNQNSLVGLEQPVLVVCDMTRRDVLTAVSDYLQTSGLVATDLSVELVPVVGFASAKVRRLLAEDEQAGRVSFVIIRDGIVRRYFKTADQDDFSVHLTSL